MNEYLEGMKEEKIFKKICTGNPGEKEKKGQLGKW